MNRGAYWAGSPLRSEEEPRDPAPDSALALPVAMPEQDPDPVTRSIGETIVLGLVALTVVAWLAATGFAGYEAWRANGGLAIGDAVRGIALASGPLALIAIVVLLWQRNAPREAARYADAARGIRTETLALDAVLALASRRLAEDRGAVAEQADRLLALADETSAKIGAATAGIAREVAELGRQGRELDAAAGTARVDMGVLLADLPIAEGQVRGLADTLREAGTGAHQQAAALQEALAALARHARDAEESGAGAASRLSAQVSRIAGAAEITVTGIDDAGARMQSVVDGVLVRAAEAVERARAGIATQGEAVGAMIERTGAAADAAAAAGAAAIEARMAALLREAETLAAALGAQDRIGADMIERLQRGLGAIEARFAELDESGRARTERLGEALGVLGGHAGRTMAALNDGGVSATTLINRTETLRAALAVCLAELEDGLPAAVARLEDGAARARDTIGATVPEIERLGEAAGGAARGVADAHDALDRRREGIETLAAATATRTAEMREAVAALAAAIVETDARAERLTNATSPRLLDALVRVRETAGQAAERAREALDAIVPQSAAALGEAGRRALSAAVDDTVEQQIDRVAQASETAAETVRGAVERLESQLSRIAETSAAIDDQVAAGRAEVETYDRDNFSRRVAHLIDALNSTGIDVAKLLAGETDDTAWGAYLRGDRGVFTRRAVRLLDGSEARAVARQYEGDETFRGEVNRYVHDFEALLRPILSTRDGSALAVILLSSDMGKLYVALAQAIERLRT